MATEQPRGFYRTLIAVLLVGGALGVVGPGAAAAKAPPKDSALVAHISGLSAGAKVDIVLSGPTGRRLLTRAQTIRRLRPGHYHLVPRNVGVRGGTEEAEGDVAVNLVAKRTSVVNVAYLFVPSGSTPTTTPVTTTPVTTTTMLPTTTTTAALSTTTTAAPTTTTTAAGLAGSGLIEAGPSRNECAIVDVVGTANYADLESAISGWDATTHTTANCIGSYLNGAQNWSQWTSAWITGTQYGYTTWVAQAPQSRQLVLQVDLIPESLKNVNDPLGWETSCAQGDFNGYATELGNSLVAAGLGNSVLRLGAEANGPWESDFIGTTTQEQNLWATCFANEVTGLRQATGGHFLIDWNPNACTEAVAYDNYYPGNAYVDILGLDLYDVGCEQPTTALSFSELSAEPYGLNSFEAFAASVGKPMSFPEWGLVSTPSGDDPGYINGMASAVESGNFAFQEYFDVVGGTMPLNSSTSLSLGAYESWLSEG
jgi:hypothetical protein